MMSNNYPKISIIMPVYNSKNYIDAAINSVLKQTYKHYELIIVDDGSTDGSSEICDTYSDFYNVRVFHKPNGGVCSARNLGINVALGEYICFIDNDDEYEPEYCEKLIKIAEETDADVVKCGRKNIVVNIEGKVLFENCKSVEKNNNYSLDEFKDNYIEIKKTEIFCSVWNGLYKLEKVKTLGVFFDENIKNGNEDLIFNYKLLRKCETISIISEVLYKHYYRNGHSTSLKFNKNQVETRIEAVMIEFDFANSEQERKYILAEGIRECFRILSYCDEWDIRKKYSKFIEKQLLHDKNFIFWISRCREISIINKFELFFILLHLYNLYFLIRNLRRKIKTNGL